jgi:NAD(P)-dependent dehydrogenase (short-subunit alcohol dehydrogenase family)
MKLKNKVSVITGGNSGIGLAAAREFRANGAEVAIFGRSRQTLDLAIKSLGDEVLAIQGDVRKLGDLDRLFEESAKKFGKIDILVANAGIAKFAPIESLSEELFDELCDIHFKGTFFTVQRDKGVPAPLSIRRQRGQCAHWPARCRLSCFLDVSESTC